MTRVAINGYGRIGRGNGWTGTERERGRSYDRLIEQSKLGMFF